MSDAGGPELVQVHPQLAIERDSVTCSYNSATLDRPVSVDTALDALLAMPGRCVDVLANDDSDWNQRTCEGDGYNAPPDPGFETCNLALVALLLYRRQRGSRNMR